MRRVAFYVHGFGGPQTLAKDNSLEIDWPTNYLRSSQLILQFSTTIKLSNRQGCREMMPILRKMRTASRRMY